MRWLDPPGERETRYWFITHRAAATFELWFWRRARPPYGLRRGLRDGALRGSGDECGTAMYESRLGGKAFATAIAVTRSIYSAGQSTLPPVRKRLARIALHEQRPARGWFSRCAGQPSL